MLRQPKTGVVRRLLPFLTSTSTEFVSTQILNMNQSNNLQISLFLLSLLLAWARAEFYTVAYYNAANCTAPQLYRVSTAVANVCYAAETESVMYTCPGLQLQRWSGNTNCEGTPNVQTSLPGCSVSSSYSSAAYSCSSVENPVDLGVMGSITYYKDNATCGAAVGSTIIYKDLLYGGCRSGTIGGTNFRCTSPPSGPESVERLSCTSSSCSGCSVSYSQPGVQRRSSALSELTSLSLCLSQFELAVAPQVDSGSLSIVSPPLWLRRWQDRRRRGWSSRRLIPVGLARSQSLSTSMPQDAK